MQLFLLEINNITVIFCQIFVHALLSKSAVLKERLVLYGLPQCANKGTTVSKVSCFISLLLTDYLGNDCINLTLSVRGSNLRRQESDSGV